MIVIAQQSRESLLLSLLYHPELFSPSLYLLAGILLLPEIALGVILTRGSAIGTIQIQSRIVPLRLNNTL